MNSKHLKGLAVISIADGEKLGTIDRVYLDPATKQAIGFAVKHGGGLFGGAPPDVIDVDDIHSLGPDAMTIADKGALQGNQTAARFDELVDLDHLLKRKVVTEGGTLVGQVAGADFDEASFGVQQIEVSPGFFKGNIQVPIEQITSIGHELVVVADAVCAVAEPTVTTTSVVTAGSQGQPSTEGRFVVGDVAPRE